MKALVVYESMFGNSESVARSISRGLARHLRVQMTSVEGAPSPEAFDLVVVGGPTHAFSMTRPQTRKDALAQGATSGCPDTGIREWLADLPHSADRQLVATFDTRVEKVRHLPGSAARKAAKVLGRLGYRTAAPPESFYVAGTTGPLGDGELARAEAWGERLGAEVGTFCPSAPEAALDTKRG